ncbi:MAG: hypothetical protein HW404_413 [Anaerolineales bacterium]|jgi:hypothetical protein|nr:hypothetical protein [Anaerolineales bacterium]MBM2842576.1 hypothetical protein [Anaerolineales bacterium]
MTKQSINKVVDGLVRTGSLEVPRIEEALQAKLTQTNKNDFWTFYEFKLSNGPFAHGEFRLSNDGSKALLSLRTEPAKAPTEKDLDLTRWGPISGIDVNPHIRPEGIDAYIFDVQGVRVSFQLMHSSRRLRSVALEWGTSRQP